MSLDKETLHKILIVVAIMGCGLLIFNQFIEWKYNAQLLMQPCALCTQLNPEWAQCYKFTQEPIANKLNFSLKIP